jgi:micrococcal nuclease
VTVAAVVLIGASGLGWWFGAQRRAADAQYRVVQVLDGDTIVVRRAGGSDETIRLLGVDTPETHHPRKPVQCFGPEAAAYTASRLFGQVVRLEDDVERHDIYGRRLAYVYLDGHNYERELLQQGYARLLVIEPNHAHARDMLDDELNARARGVGLWAACGDSA